MRVLGVVPARAGSKRLPGKNMQLLGGVPLVGHAIRHALCSSVVDVIAVTTDDDAVFRYVAAEFRLELYTTERLVLVRRPPEMAMDDSPMMPVVRHAMDWCPRTQTCDVIVLLQPTSPLRTGADVRDCVDLLGNNDSVVSVTACPLDWAFRVGFAGRMREAPGIVVPNGAVYVLTRGAIEAGEDWYSGVVRAYKMPKDRSLDVDTPLDLTMARAAVEDHAEAGAV